MLKPFFFLPLEMMKHRNSRRFRSTSHQNLSTNRNDKLIFFLCFLLFSERKSRLVHTMTSSAWVEMAKRNSMLRRRRRRRRPPRLLPLLYSGDNEELKTLSLENDSSSPSFSPFSSSSFLCTLIEEEIRRPLIHWMFLK